MSPRLNLCSGKEGVKKFKKAGWQISRQKGSHVIVSENGLSLHTFRASAQRIRNWNFIQTHKTSWAFN